MPTKVLVVDDDPAMCDLVQTVGASAGMEVATLTDSAQATARLSEEKFDAVFLDLRMPSPDGFELARQVRASRLNQKTPIVMITGEDDPKVLARGFQAGASFFMFKPIDRQGLLRIIRASQGVVQRERRRFHRVTVHCKVSIESKQQKVNGTTLDISLNGMLVRAAQIFPVGAKVQLNLYISEQEDPLRAVGQVARVVGNDGMGIQFETLTMAESERLQEFLLPLILSKLDEAPTER